MKFTALCFVLVVAVVQSGSPKQQAPVQAFVEPAQAIVQERGMSPSANQVMTWCTNMMTSLKMQDYASFLLRVNEESMFSLNNPLLGVLDSAVHGLNIKNLVRQIMKITDISETNFEIVAVDEAKATCIAQWNSTGNFVRTGAHFDNALSTMITKFSCGGMILSQTSVSTDPQLYLGYSTKAEKAMGKIWWTWFSDPNVFKLTLDSTVFGLISPQVKLTIATLPHSILSQTAYTGHQGLLDARQEIFTKLIHSRDLVALKDSKFVILYSDDAEVYMSLPLVKDELEGIVKRFFHLKFDASGLLVEVNLAFPHVIRPWDLATQPGAVSPPGARPAEMLQGQQ